jgi:hypothetical protein
LKRSILFSAILLFLPAIALAELEERLDDATLKNLIFSFEDNVQLQPGQTHSFSLNVFECCVFLKQVKARVSWSVEPAVGAHIDPRTGLLEIDPSTPGGSVFTVIADVENGRRLMSTKLYVFTPESDPLVGNWRETSQVGCDGSETGKPEAPVEELEFRADGRFSVTWRPFEIRKDYWGTYAYDLKNQTLSLVVEGGNDVPAIMDREGAFSVDQTGRLTLKGMWLGSPDQRRVAEAERGKLRPNICSTVFSHG